MCSVRQEAHGEMVDVVQDQLMSYNSYVMNAPFCSISRSASLETRAERGEVSLMSIHPSDVLCLQILKFWTWTSTPAFTAMSNIF